MTVPDTLATFGPFFEVGTHDRPLPPPWRPMTELSANGTALTGRVSQVRTSLAGSRAEHSVETRVAASVAQLGLVARLAAPALGLAVLGARSPLADLEDVYWRAEVGGPFPLSLPTRLMTIPAAVSEDAPLQAFLDGPVTALVYATSAITTVAPRVLWGNVASTVQAAGMMLGTARPDLAARAEAITAAALGHTRLRAGYERRQGSFRRLSCCLLYRAFGTARPRSVCVDCVLEP